jgi:hypothetical protein
VTRVSKKQLRAEHRAWRRRIDRQHTIAWTFVLTVMAVTLILPIILR